MIGEFREGIANSGTAVSCMGVTVAVSCAPRSGSVVPLLSEEQSTPHSSTGPPASCLSQEAPVTVRVPQSSMDESSVGDLFLNLANDAMQKC